MRFGVPEQSNPESGRYVTPMAGTVQGRSTVKVEKHDDAELRTSQVASPKPKVNARELRLGSKQTKDRNFVTLLSKLITTTETHPARVIRRTITMPPKREVTYSACPEAKKSRRHSPPPTSQPKATRDIRSFFTSQGSPIERRTARQGSAAHALKLEAEKKKETEKHEATTATIERTPSPEPAAERQEQPPSPSELSTSDTIKPLNRKILDNVVSVFDTDDGMPAKDIDKTDPKTRTSPLLTALRNTPPRDWSTSPPSFPLVDAAKLATQDTAQKKEKTQEAAKKPMLVKALEDAKATTTPTVQTSIESAVVVEEHPTEKKAESPEVPVSKEEEDAKPKFDKEKWAKENLTEEQRELLGLEVQTLDPSWFEVLKDELKSKSFLDLKRFLMAEHKAGKTIFPPAEDVYSW